MNMILRWRMEEVCKICQIDETIITTFVQEQWLIPFDRENYYFDQEDISRIHLILELKNHFGVNDEGIPIILHLVDELNAYRLSRN